MKASLELAPSNTNSLQKLQRNGVASMPLNFPLGLHGDGVPIQGRMNQDTLDFITINMPCSPLHSQIRIPVTCIEKKFNAGVQTVNQGARVASMWEHIQSLYKAEGTPWGQRLPKLTLKDIHKPKNTTSLDCKAVHCRYFWQIFAEADS